MRGVWIVACLIGVIAAGGLAVLMGYVVVLDIQAGNIPSARGLVWPVGLLLFAGACGAGLFLTPREMHALTKPDPDPEPAAWIKEMRRDSDGKSE